MTWNVNAIDEIDLLITGSYCHNEAFQKDQALLDFILL